jgi:WD40 repeat protein
MDLAVGMAPGYLDLSFSADGRRVAAGSATQSVSVWDVASGEEIAHFVGHRGRVWSVALSPDGTRVASGSDDRTVRIWDVASGEEVARLETGAAVWSVAFSSDGKRLAAASDVDDIRLWDAASGEQISLLRGHTGRVLSVAFSPDGTRLASASEDQTVRLWDLTAGGEMAAEDRSAYFERAPTVESIYQASLYLLGLRVDGAEIEPEPRPLFLTPVGDFRFREHHGYWKLAQPRPPDTDPIAWIVEAMEDSER